LFGILAVTGSLGLSLWLALGAYYRVQLTDAALRSRFQGAAFEDVFGFGFWPAWLLLVAAQAVVLTIAWLHLGKSRRVGQWWCPWWSFS
jgi:hypothetical protein